MESNEKIKCPKCDKYCYPMGLRTHLWRVHGKGKDFKPIKGRTPWNKGLTRENNPIVDNISKSLERVKSPLEQKLDDDGKLIQRWRNKCVNAKKEGIKCNLTFEEYCQLVDDAGLVSSQLGFTGQDYVLARYKDSGNYEIGNCRFITQQENSDEKNERLFHTSTNHSSFKAFLDYYNALEQAGIDPWH